MCFNADIYISIWLVQFLCCFLKSEEKTCLHTLGYPLLESCKYMYLLLSHSNGKSMGWIWLREICVVYKPGKHVNAVKCGDICEYDVVRVLY